MITVVIATHNGGERLRTTLGSFLTFGRPKSSWKLIVVDNDSSDDSSVILDAFKTQLPLLTLFQPERGKNIALNTALPHLEGSLIVFTDDDVVVPADWLDQFEALARAQPNYTIFGGRIVPLWPYDPPAAVLNGIPLSPAFAVHRGDILSGPIRPGLIWGANMMVRRHVFDEGDQFDECIGPNSGNYIMGSETEFLTRLHKLGHQCYFFSEIVVKHIIREEQLTLKWLQARAFRAGRDGARKLTAQEWREFKCIGGLPIWHTRQLIGDCRRWIRARLGQDTAKTYEASWKLHHRLGWLKEARKRPRSA